MASVSVPRGWRSSSGRTLTGFLLKMKNDSALWVRKRVNLWTKTCSISSACFMRMLTRTLFMLGSIMTFSFSFLAIVNGLSSTSGDVAASISGTLWRSEAWEAKLANERAAVSDDRTHCRYGRSDCDCWSVSLGPKALGLRVHTMMHYARI